MPCCQPTGTEVPLLKQSWPISCGQSDGGPSTAGDIFCRQDISEPASVPVVFDSGCRQAFIATLQGTVLALKHAPGSDSVAHAWAASAGGPVLSTPAVLPACSSLLVASVHGSVRAFSSGRGALFA